MQIGQFADLARVERAALALSLGGLAGVPHEEVGDQLSAALEQLQRDWAAFPDQLDCRIDFDHGQPPASRRYRVTLASVSLLPSPQSIHFGLPNGPVDHRGERESVVVASRRQTHAFRVIVHCRIS
jgi:hypothetical protein